MEAQNDSLSTPTITISQCVTLKLNETNYLVWKLQFEQFLSSQMLLGIVNGTTPRPSPTFTVRNGEQVTEASNPEFLKWVRSDQLVMAWLFGSLYEDALKTVYGLRSSHEVLFALAKKYNRVSATRRLDLQRRIQTTTKGNKYMAEYLAEIKSFCDQLDSIGSPITEQEKIYGLLNGLGKEYESICTVIENSMDSFPGPYFEDAAFKLTGFDDKIKAYDTQVAVNPNLTFYLNRGAYFGRGRGHFRGGNRGRNSYSTRGRGFHQQFASNSNSRPTCQICGKYGHSAFTCYNRFDENYQQELTQAMTTVRLSDQDQSSGREWFPDTGASAHITNSTHNLQQATHYNGNDSVMIGDGNFLLITHIGSVPLQTMSGQANKADPDTRKQA